MTQYDGDQLSHGLFVRSIPGTDDRHPLLLQLFIHVQETAYQRGIMEVQQRLRRLINAQPADIMSKLPEEQ